MLLKNRLATAFLCLSLGLCSSFAQAKERVEPANKDSESSSQKVTQSDTEQSEQTPKKHTYSLEARKHYNRGLDLHQSGFFNQAISAYQQAIAADNTMEEAYTNLGLIYTAQRNFSKALDAFNKALKLRSNRPKTLNGLASVLYAKGKYQEAIERWKQAVSIDPKFGDAYCNMGTAMENQKDYTGAREAYANALKADPNLSNAYYRLASIFNKQEHLAQASLLYNKALELAPESDNSSDIHKQLKLIENQFAKEQDEQPEINMNILPPVDNTKNKAQAKPDAQADNDKDSANQAKQ